MDVCRYVDNKIKGHCYLVHARYGGICPTSAGAAGETRWLVVGLTCFLFIFGMGTIQEEARTKINKKEKKEKE